MKETRSRLSQFLLLTSPFIFYLATAMLFTCSLFTGCREDATVGRYQVPHERRVASGVQGGAPSPSGVTTEASTNGASEQRMLAAIIPIGQRAWFVKATGTPADLESQKASFDAFVQSWVLDESEASPRWTEPQGWKPRATPGTMRFATLDAPGMEVSVTVLPMPEQPWEEYLVANVNRWRGQLQLEPASLETIQQQARTLAIGSIQATLVDLSGKAAPGGPSPMPSNRSSATSESASTPASVDGAQTSGGSQASDGTRFTVPTGWQPGRVGTFRIAAFDIQQDGKTAEVTISALGGASGTLLDNVNRWRSQISQSDISDTELAQLTTPIEVGGQTGQLVDLTGTEDGSERQGILAVVVPQGNRTIFVKMMGNRNLVVTQRTAFEQFVKSLQFPAK